MCSVSSVLADTVGDGEMFVMDVQEVEPDVDIVVSEVPGDPSLLLDDVPMLLDVNTPLNEFQRLPTVGIDNSGIGGLRYGNSINASGGYSVSYYANCIPAYNTPGAHEVIFEYIFNTPVDHDKFYLTSSNEPKGFTVGYRRLYSSGSSLFSKVDGISYIDDYTVRVSVNFSSAIDHEFMYAYVNSENAYNGVTINIYSRKINNFAMIGGDGGGGSEGGGGAAT